MQRHAVVLFALYAPQLPVRRDRSPRAPVSTHPPQLAGVRVHRTAVKKGLSVRCDKAEPVVPLPLAANCFTSCDFGSLESMGAGTHVTKLLAVADDATPRRSRSALSNACADRTGRTACITVIMTSETTLMKRRTAPVLTPTRFPPALQDSFHLPNTPIAGTCHLFNNFVNTISI
jgi:hypothetical protein